MCITQYVLFAYMDKATPTLVYQIMEFLSRIDRPVGHCPHGGNTGVGSLVRGCFGEDSSGLHLWRHNFLAHRGVLGIYN
jgi:hypothetical protein